MAISRCPNFSRGLKKAVSMYATETLKGPWQLRSRNFPTSNIIFYFTVTPNLMRVRMPLSAACAH